MKGCHELIAVFLEHFTFENNQKNFVSYPPMNEWSEQSCHQIPRDWTISCNEGFQMNATRELFNLRLSVCKIRPYNFVCFLGIIK